MKYSEGPWKFKIGDSFSATDYIVEQDTTEEHWVVLRWEPGPYRDPALEQANGTLIAAAPQLLEALLDLMDACSSSCEDKRLIDAQRNAEAAILKAYGGE